MRRLLPYQRLPGACEGVARPQRRSGRLALDTTQRARLARLHQTANTAEPTEENQVLGLLTRPFTTDDVPEYYRYTSLHVFGWFLDQQAALRQWPEADEPLAGCILALHAILDDLAHVEAREADGLDVVPAHTLDRLARLGNLMEQLYDVPIDRHLRGKDVVEHAESDERMRRLAFLVARCSGFPISDKHDEHLFLRSVHACELVFYAARWIAVRAAGAMRHDPEEALFRINQLTIYAELLNHVLHLLQTLSPEQFMGFRDATGAASAVQSLNYHTMELAIYGYDERKASVYAGFPHLGRLGEPAFRDYQPLAALVAQSPDTRIANAFASADHTLLTWRARHYGFARRYLADIKSSGGTDGAAYLKRFIRKLEDRWPGARVTDAARALQRFAYC
jgi:tryptophan 2,3-dioxygenase